MVRSESALGKVFRRGEALLQAWAGTVRKAAGGGMALPGEELTAGSAGRQVAIGGWLMGRHVRKEK